MLFISEMSCYNGHERTGMKLTVGTFLAGILGPLSAFAANEGVPSYYQTTTTNANQQAYGQYADQGYTKYVGQSGTKQVVGTRTYSYQVPRQIVPDVSTGVTGAMTTNGIAMPIAEDEHGTSIYAGYSRRFADFQFETGVNSVLEWDDMIFNEINLGARHVFSLRNFDLFAYGDYTHGWMESGGLSMDYDLAPFDWTDPSYGIFTISMGNQTGSTDHLRLGFGAHHVWDIGGWKLSPSIGYEIFKHNLEMSDHIYPNQGVYLPLLTQSGDYIFGYYNDDNELVYQAVAQGAVNSVPDDWYQVCMTPDDIKVVPDAPNGNGYYGSTLDPSTDWIPNGTGISGWGVGANECVIVGGDGPIQVNGTTHIYNTTWSGIYLGLEIEKQMTLKDKLRMYFQVSMPKYSSEGTWPNRTDWQQHPSFLDEGTSGSYAYAAELEYNYRLSERVQLSLKVDTNYFHIGNIGGELYVASYVDCVRGTDGFCQIDFDEETGDAYYTLEEVPAHTEPVSDSLKKAVWQSFGLSLNVKYSF